MRARRTRPKPQDIKIHYPQRHVNSNILSFDDANVKANETKKLEKDSIGG